MPIQFLLLGGGGSGDFLEGGGGSANFISMGVGIFSISLLSVKKSLSSLNLCPGLKFENMHLSAFAFANTPFYYTPFCGTPTFVTARKEIRHLELTLGASSPKESSFRYGPSSGCRKGGVWSRGGV